NGEHTMLDLFREEVRVHLLALGRGTDALAAGAAALPDDVSEALRQIKGAARGVKCAPGETAGAAVSGFLGAVRDGRLKPAPDAAGWVGAASAVLAGVIATDAESYPAWLESASVPLAEIASTLRGVVGAAPPAPPPPKPVPVSRAEARPA